jgi:hypothetical protein
VENKRKRWTYEEIFNYFLEQGCFLLSTSFTKQKDILDYICVCGNKSTTNFDNFKRGKRCEECKKVKCGNIRRLTYDEVKRRFEEVGCALLSTTYKNSTELLDFICVCGEKNKISLMALSSGRLCYNCGLKKISENLKLTYDYVKNIFESSGCILLSKTYNSAKEKLNYICDCGNEGNTSFDKFQAGQRCNVCKLRMISEKNRVPFEEVVELFKDENCELLITEEEYINSSTAMRYRCECGKEDYTILYNLLNGARCQRCADAKRRQTMYNNQTAPVSMQQRHIANLLSGKINYPVFTSSLDVAFLEDKFYIEYNGSGHWLAIHFGQKTKEEFEVYERERRYALRRRGWKEIAITSRKDCLPSDNKIIEMISYAKKYFQSGHSWIEFDIDSGDVKCSQYQIGYDYGDLKSYYQFRKELLDNQQEVCL